MDQIEIALEEEAGAEISAMKEAQSTRDEVTTTMRAWRMAKLMLGHRCENSWTLHMERWTS